MFLFLIVVVVVVVVDVVVVVVVSSQIWSKEKHPILKGLILVENPESNILMPHMAVVIFTKWLFGQQQVCWAKFI